MAEGLASMAKPPLRARPMADDDAAPDSSPDMGGDSADPGLQAAHTMMEAIKDDDAESFADALGAFLDMREADSMGAGGPPAAGAAPPKPALKVTIGRAVK